MLLYLIVIKTLSRSPTSPTPAKNTRTISDSYKANDAARGGWDFRPKKGSSLMQYSYREEAPEHVLLCTAHPGYDRCRHLFRWDFHPPQTTKATYLDIYPGGGLIGFGVDSNGLVWTSASQLTHEQIAKMVSFFVLYDPILFPKVFNEIPSTFLSLPFTVELSPKYIACYADSPPTAPVYFKFYIF